MKSSRRFSCAAAGAVALIASATAPAQTTGTPRATGAQSEAIPLDPAVRTGVLANGLRYFVRQNTRPEKRLELRLVVNAGAVLEDDDQRGLAHFTEHMLFNGTRRFKKNDIVSYLESIGVRFGADLNAYTGFDETVYILPVPTDKPGLVERSFDVLEDWASGALFDSTEVVNERGVVLEEWRSGLGADSRIRDRQFPVLFRGSRYADRLPIGLPEIIRAANPAPLRRFYTDWYRPDLMAVVAVGDANPDSIEALIKSRFSNLARPARPRVRPVVPVPGHDSALVTIATDREQDVSVVQVLYKHDPVPLNTVGDYRTLLLRQLYNSMFNQRLNEITRQPNAPFSFASSSYSSLVRSKDAYFLAAVVADGGIERGLEALLREARRVDQHGFLASELARAKTSLLRSLESANAEREKTESESFAGEYIRYYLEHEPSPGIAWEYQTAQRVLPEVTLAEVNELGRRWITETNRVVAVAAPDKPEVRVPDEVQLLAVFRRADAEAVTAYTETVSEAPLVTTVPPRGRVVQESRIDALNVTDWRLSNGVRVLVKPTDFKADEVIMRAWSAGGLSLVADEDYISGALATTIVERGGVADFPAIELGKKLTGKRVGLSSFIGELSEGLSGTASPQDLETLLQLAYLRFTAPRLDSAAFQALLAQFNTVLANRANIPEVAFQDTIDVTMSQNHPRSRPLDAKLLESVKLDRAFQIYRDRLGDATDLTFVFVGAVNPDSLRPLVEQWIGTLPAAGRQERWRDIGRRGPSGVVEKTVRKGTEPKASTLVFFTGEAPFNPANRYALRSLAELLQMKMLETMREALGGTYSVTVSGSSAKVPREEYTVVVQFGSSPDKADTLFRSALAIIDSVKTFGVSDSDVQKVREQQQRTQEVQVKQNGYWAGNISARLENGEDPAGLLAYNDFIRNLTGEQIKQAAIRFLNTARYARFVLLPERVVP
jgi:zinc protease